jgi:hypothetical protein
MPIVCYFGPNFRNGSVEVAEEAIRQIDDRNRRASALAQIVVRDCRHSSPSLARTNSRLARNSKTRDARCVIRGGTGRKTAMTEIDGTLDPFLEAEIKEHHAALIRQMVAIGAICLSLLLVIGFH